MAIFPERRELTKEQIDALAVRIAREENATNIRYVGPTTASYVYLGLVENKEIKFCVDNESGAIVTEED